MPTLPTFASLEAYAAHVADVDLWRPLVERALERHDLPSAADTAQPGHNATYPTFVVGDVVVKWFGWLPHAARRHAAEVAALERVAALRDLAVPRIVAHGHLAEPSGGGGAAWSYLITTRVPGIPAWRADLAANEERALAHDLGRAMRRVHALPTAGIAPLPPVAHLDVGAAAARSSLPPHLAAQAQAFAGRLAPPDAVLVHGDLIANHAYLDGTRLVGIIDWGDALVADRHYELAQLHRDAFRCDRGLLRAFLEGYDWPVAEDFAETCLGYALVRQAVGLLQHPTIDVFQPVAERLPLGDLATLDELAAALFDV